MDNVHEDFRASPIPGERITQRWMIFSEIAVSWMNPQQRFTESVALKHIRCAWKPGQENWTNNRESHDVTDSLSLRENDQRKQIYPLAIRRGHP